MATAKDFINQIGQVAGVEGCLLVRKDGVLIGQSLPDPEYYSTLLVIGGGQAAGVMDSAGFSSCQYLSYRRANNQHLHVFPIDKFLLGVVQQPECHLPDMLAAVYRLISRVATSKSVAPQKGGK